MGYSPWNHRESDTNKHKYDFMLPRIQLQRSLRFLLNYPSFLEHFPQPCIPLGGYNVGPTFLYRPVWGRKNEFGFIESQPSDRDIAPLALGDGLTSSDFHLSCSPEI